MLDFKDFLGNYQVYNKLNNTIIYNAKLSLIEYIEKILELVGVPLTSIIKENIVKELTDEKVINHYKNFSDVDRVMTIHASKGLEADSVYVVLNKVYKYDEEYKRKLFVAFTRAKNNLYISKSRESSKMIEPIDYDFRNILKKLSC